MYNNGVSIVIPVFNEEKGIGEVIKEILEEISKTKINYELIIVNDGSTDSTNSILSDIKEIKLLTNLQNIGYGASLKRGILKAQYNYIIITDGDGTYPTSGITKIISNKERSDMIICSRTSNNVKIPLIRRPAKFIIKLVAQYLVGKKILDINSGLRGFDKNIAIKFFNLLSDKFSFTSSLTLCMLYNNKLIEYFEIDYLDRKGKSKIRYLDFFTFLSLIFKLSFYFNPMKLFSPLSLFFFIIGFLKIIMDFIMGYISNKNLSFIFFEETMSLSSFLLISLSLNFYFFGLLADSLAKRFNT